MPSLMLIFYTLINQVPCFFHHLIDMLPPSASLIFIHYGPSVPQYYPGNYWTYSLVEYTVWHWVIPKWSIAFRWLQLIWHKTSQSEHVVHEKHYFDCLLQCFNLYYESPIPNNLTTQSVIKLGRLLNVVLPPVITLVIQPQSAICR